MTHTDRFEFRAWYDGRFIYKNVWDSGYYTEDNKCIGSANDLPNTLYWEQCIGKRDKNGKRIYDNDIVTDGEDNGRIYWENTGWACTMFLWQKKPEDLEVIGNIHQNSDLL